MQNAAGQCASEPTLADALANDRLRRFSAYRCVVVEGQVLTDSRRSDFKLRHCPPSIALCGERSLWHGGSHEKCAPTFACRMVPTQCRMGRLAPIG